MKVLAHPTTLLLILAAPSPSQGEDFEKRCGECWCITTESCPPFAPGHYDAFPQDIYEAYNALRLVTDENDLPKLESEQGGGYMEQGGECFPFAHLDTIETFPKSKLPQCKYPAMSDVEGAVCAFTYDMSATGEELCDGRPYEMKTYQSMEDAGAAGAQVTHDGACGVCSSAADLAVMGGKLMDLNLKFQSCGTTYYTQVKVVKKDPNTSFDDLIQCVKKLGFTDDCALLWAHSIATTSALCVNECSKGDPYNGDPPQCALNECLTCKNQVQEEKFDILAGRTNVGSGITEPVARPCDDFSTIIHSPPAAGEGLSEDVTCPEDQKELDETSDSSTAETIHAKSVVLFLIAAGLIALA